VGRRDGNDFVLGLAKRFFHNTREPVRRFSGLLEQHIEMGLPHLRATCRVGDGAMGAVTFDLDPIARRADL